MDSSITRVVPVDQLASQFAPLWNDNPPQNFTETMAILAGESWERTSGREEAAAWGNLQASVGKNKGAASVLAKAQDLALDLTMAARAEAVLLGFALATCRELERKGLDTWLKQGMHRATLLALADTRCDPDQDR